MKISKLFHWLYAFVMFLPVFALGGTLLISTFNMSSKQESEIIYKYETNEVNSVDDLIKNNIYQLEYFNIDDLNYSSTVDLKQIHMNLIKFNSPLLANSSPSVDEIVLNEYSNDKSNVLTIDIYYGENTERYVGYGIFTNDEAYIAVEDLFTNFSIHNLVFFFNDDESLDNFKNDYVRYTNTLPTKSDYNVIDSVETHNLNTREVFYNALDDIKDSSYFSWAYNSFLAQPLVYIVTLFNIPANHIVVELLSYWLAISIIWLVFDLIMYVPLLVHRWLDKGVLE